MPWGIYNDMGNAQNLVNQISFKKRFWIVRIKIVIYANTFNGPSPKFGLKWPKLKGVIIYFSTEKLEESKKLNSLYQDLSIHVKLKFFFSSVFLCF